MGGEPHAEQLAASQERIEGKLAFLVTAQDTVIGAVRQMQRQLEALDVRLAQPLHMPGAPPDPGAPAQRPTPMVRQPSWAGGQPSWVGAQLASQAARRRPDRAEAQQGMIPSSSTTSSLQDGRRQMWAPHLRDREVPLAEDLRIRRVVSMPGRQWQKEEEARRMGVRRQDSLQSSSAEETKRMGVRKQDSIQSGAAEDVLRAPLAPLRRITSSAADEEVEMHSFFGDVRKIRSNASSGIAGSFDDDVFGAPLLPEAWPETLALRPVLKTWVTEGHTHRDVAQALVPNNRKRVRLQSSLQLEEGDETKRLLWLREPDTIPRQVVEIVGFILMLYDLVLIPYGLAWDIKHEGFVATMDWVLVSFWTFDMGLGFITGFHEDGEMVTNLRETSRRYLKRWFVPDCVMVTADWFGVFFLMAVSHGHPEDAKEASASSNVRLIKFAKLGKLIRVVDILRVLRAMKTFEVIVERHLSKHFRLMLRMVAISGAILYVNHVLACVWFAIGRNAPSDTGAHWVHEDLMNTGMRYDDASALYQYATAFHWALAQCTLSFMEVTPTNSFERVAICVCMFSGLFFGSSLVSLLSATMMELRMLSNDASQQTAILRRYLLENHVDKKMALFVQRQVTERLDAKGRLRAQDVPALEVLSAAARDELHAEITRPHMLQHPLHRLWNSIDSRWFTRLCTQAAAHSFLRPGDDLFTAGYFASSAYYVASGKLEYTQEPDSAPVQCIQTEVVEHTRWVCEQALWCEWIHVGQATAATYCQILNLKADSLLKILPAHRGIRAIATEYGKAFHHRIVTGKPPVSEWPNDVKVSFTDYGDIVASLSKDVQVAIGTIAIEAWRPTTSFWGGKPAESSKLRKEVEDGKCLVVMSGDGTVERVVSLVAMQVMQDDGQILVQLAKWEDCEVQPDCTLPAVKRERNESTDDTARRLLNTKMAPLSGLTEVVRVQHKVTREDSKHYGIPTKYLRNIYNVRMTGDFEAPICPPVARPEQDNLRSGGIAEVVDICMRLCVYFFSYKDKGIFCTWLEPEEFDLLKRSSNDPLFRHWLKCLRPPDPAGAADAPMVPIPGVSLVPEEVEPVREEESVPAEVVCADDARQEGDGEEEGPSGDCFHLVDHSPRLI